SMPTGAIIPMRLRLTCTPQLQPLPFAVRRLSRPPERPHWVAHRRTVTFIVGARRYWMAVLVLFTPRSLHSLSTMLKFAIITVGAPRRHSCYRSESVLPG